MTQTFDLAVVGGGIIGLAHAYVAARAGKRVAVIEKDIRANGASIRNFGFVTVTGQERGESWRLARRTRDVWEEVAPKAGLRIEQRGLYLVTRSAEAVAVIEAFLGTEMGEGCRLLSPAEFRSEAGGLGGSDLEAALFSPHELRLELRTVIHAFAAWLKEALSVAFFNETVAFDAAPPRLRTSRGAIEAAAVVVCPGDDFATLYPDRIARYALRKCRLSMVKLADPGFRLPGALMSDLSLVRYRGYSALPEARALEDKLRAEQPSHFENGVHLIAAQGADGGLIVGDSHHYDILPGPFAPAEAERDILDEYARATGRAAPPVLERWTGIYAVADDRTFLVDTPACGVRLVIVTSGTGASTGFGIAEQVIGGSTEREGGGMSFPVKAVVFDWAGTMIDFGCMAPVEALNRVFAEEGVSLSAEEARRDMGKAKLDHLRALLRDPQVQTRWVARKGALAGEADIDRLYRKLEPAMKAAAARASRLIPGAALIVSELRALGVKIGSGTGYTREMMADILPNAAEQGYAPGVVVCAGETPSGRPAPLMTWKALIELDAWPARACIKVDDAPVGIEEGRLAGCWTVGLSASGNGVGLDLETFLSLAPDDRRDRLARSEQALKSAGADYVIEDVSHLMPVVHAVAKRIAVP